MSGHENSTGSGASCITWCVRSECGKTSSFPVSQMWDHLCSDLDFSLHAFRMPDRIFFMKPVEEQKIKEGLSIWFERSNVI